MANSSKIVMSSAIFSLKSRDVRAGVLNYSKFFYTRLVIELNMLLGGISFLSKFDGTPRTFYLKVLSRLPIWKLFGLYSSDCNVF